MLVHLLLYIIVFISLSLAQPKTKDDNYLKPFINELKQVTPKEYLTKIREMSEDQLIELHFDYGMWIRNKWLWGNRNDSLVKYFQNENVNHPDDMSMELIKALWSDLNDELTSDERKDIEERRNIRIEKNNIINRICDEGSQYLKTNKNLFLKCYTKYGNSSKNPSSIDPFYYMIIKNDGSVDSVVFFDGASDALKKCLGEILYNYKFTPFKFFDSLSLYVIEYPYCNVNERGRY